MKTSPDHQRTVQAIKEQLADADSEWWPFLFLRPAQDQRFTSTRCAALALMHGIPVALIAVVGGRLIGDQVRDLDLLLFPLLVSVCVFAMFRLGIAPFWNRRAAQLAPLHDRRRQWQRSLMD